MSQLAVVKKNNLKVKEAKVGVIAKQVYHQLLPDFPVSAIQWVKNTHFLSPQHIKLKDIDFSQRANWKAEHEPQKVNLHAKLIEEDKGKPIILIKLPGHDKLFCCDGHHRLLAFEKLTQNPLAYVGIIRPADTEAAVKMHGLQFHGGSRLDGT